MSISREGDAHGALNSFRPLVRQPSSAIVPVRVAVRIATLLLCLLDLRRAFLAIPCHAAKWGHHCQSHHCQTPSLLEVQREQACHGSPG